MIGPLPTYFHWLVFCTFVFYDPKIMSVSFVSYNWINDFKKTCHLHPVLGQLQCHWHGHGPPCQCPVGLWYPGVHCPLVTYVGGSHVVSCDSAAELITGSGQIQYHCQYTASGMPSNGKLSELGVNNGEIKCNCSSIYSACCTLFIHLGLFQFHCGDGDFIYS